MAKEMQYNEEIAWARLRKKVKQRGRGKGSRVKAILSCLGILLVLALGITAYALSQQTLPLVLPESVTIQPVVAADQTQLQPEDFVKGLANTGIQVELTYDAQKLGHQEAVLTFSRRNERCVWEAPLYLFHLEPSLTFAQ